MAEGWVKEWNPAWILLEFSLHVCTGKWRLDGAFRKYLLLLPCLLQAGAEQGHIHPLRGSLSVCIHLWQSSLDWFCAVNTERLKFFKSFCLIFILLVAHDPAWLVLPVLGHYQTSLGAVANSTCCVFSKLTNPSYLSKICDFNIIYWAFLSIVPLICFFSACPSTSCSSNWSSNYFSVLHWQINVTFSKL